MLPLISGLSPQLSIKIPEQKPSSKESSFKEFYVKNFLQMNRQENLSYTVRLRTWFRLIQPAVHVPASGYYCSLSLLPQVPTTLHFGPRESARGKLTSQVLSQDSRLKKIAAPELFLWPRTRALFTQVSCFSGSFLSGFSVPHPLPISLLICKLTH